MRIRLPNGEQIEFPLHRLIWIPVLLLILLVVSFGSTVAFQVNPEEEGVVLVFGRHSRTVGPGLHWKMPYPLSRVHKVKTSTVDVEEFGYRSKEGDRSYRAHYAENKMLTGDLNILLVGWDVQFQRSRPTHYLFHVRDPVGTLRDIAQSVMRKIIGDRASIRILTVGRKGIKSRARELIQQQADQFEMGVDITDVNLVFSFPPDEVRGAFDELNKAEQDAARFFQEASQKYEQRVPKARGEAERIKLKAEGFADRRTNLAQGKATRFNAMLAEYHKAPQVTRQRLFFETMQEVLPELEETVVVDHKLRSILPHLDLRGKGATKQGSDR